MEGDSGADRGYGWRVEHRRALTVLGSALVVVLLGAAPVAADHLTPSGKIFGTVTAYEGSSSNWTVEIEWVGECHGAPGGADMYDGDIYVTDLATGERKYVGGFAARTGVSEVRYSSGPPRASSRSR